MNTALFSRLTEAERYFTGTSYGRIVSEAVEAFEAGNEPRTRQLLNSLPTRDFLLAKVLSELKGKKVHETLTRSRILKEETGSDIEFMKAMFSLGTHVIIQMQREGKEYGILLPLIYEKIGKLLLENDI